MEKLSTEKTRAIGVSNFNIANLEKLAKTQKIVPAANQVRHDNRVSVLFVLMRGIYLQVELHPYLPQDELVKYCKDHGILVTAYSPLGSTNSPFLNDTTVVSCSSV